MISPCKLEQLSNTLFAAIKVFMQSGGPGLMSVVKATDTPVKLVGPPTVPTVLDCEVTDDRPIGGEVLVTLPGVIVNVNP